MGGTKRRKRKKNIYKFISKEEDSVTAHIMFTPSALMQFQVAAGRHLTFTKSTIGLPLAGSVKAGFPSPEEEALCDIMSVDEFLITKPDASFLLKVSGDSMIGEGIMEGDLVIVERGRTPQIGDVVIAEVDGEWTMKYFKKENGEVYLEAANPKYPIIRPRTDLQLGGVVTGVIRKYH